MTVASLLPAAAAAQTVPNPTGIEEPRSVLERDRPEYRPVGGRLGSFFLYPQATAAVTATDNVFASEERKEADVYANLSANAQLISGFSRHSLNLRAFLDQTLHARFSRENRTEFGASANGRLDWTRDTRISLGVQVERRAESRTSFDNLEEARSPIRLNRANVALAADHKGNRAILGGEVRLEKLDYLDTTALDGSVLSQDYRDFNRAQASVYTGYAVRPGVALLVRGTADTLSYELGPDNALEPVPLDRDSSGYRLEAGVRLDISELIFGEARVGYFERDYADPALLDPSGLSVGVDLLYNITQLTSLRLRADRLVDESSSRVIAGNRRTVIAASVEHELRRNLLLAGMAEFRAIKPLGVEGDGQQVMISGGPQYLANRRLRFFGNYAFATRSASDDLRREFTEHRLTGGVTLAL